MAPSRSRRGSAGRASPPAPAPAARWDRERQRGLSLAGQVPGAILPMPSLRCFNPLSPAQASPTYQLFTLGVLEPPRHVQSRLTRHIHCPRDKRGQIHITASPLRSHRRAPKPLVSQPHTCGNGSFALQEQLEAVGLVVERAVVQSRVPVLRHPVQRPPAWDHRQVQGSRAQKHQSPMGEQAGDTASTWRRTRSG